MVTAQVLRRSYSGRLKEITVLSIDPQTYPQFCKDRDHAYLAISDDQRLREIVSICAAVLVQQTLSTVSPALSVPAQAPRVPHAA